MKICMISHGFSHRQIRKQPWVYMHVLASHLADLGFNIVVLTDDKDTRSTGTYHLRHVESLRLLPLRDAKLYKILDDEDPQFNIWMMGLSNLLYIHRIKSMRAPNIIVLTSPIYTWKDFLRLGIREFFNSFLQIFTNFIGTLIPRMLMRSFFNSDHVVKVVVLSESNAHFLKENGVHPEKIAVIPPGIDYFESDTKVDVEKTRDSIGFASEDFIVTYMGPPFRIRGVDTLIIAAAKVRRIIPQLRILILSRNLNDFMAISEEFKVRSLVSKLNVDSIVHVVTRNLSRRELRDFILVSDVVALPFKLVQSDSPISVLEALSLGKLVLSTDVDGIPNMLTGNRGVIVERNNPHALAEALLEINRTGRSRGITAGKIMSWKEVGVLFEGVLREVAEESVGDRWL